MPKHWRKLLAEAERPRVTPELLDELRALLDEARVRPDEPMSAHTSYRIGGPAELFLEVESAAELERVLPLLAEAGLPVFVVGGGSNVLVRDGGIRGVVLRLGRGFDWLEITEEGETDRVEVGAARSLGQVVKQARLRGWEAFTPIGGTPGSMGGALRMNAGGRDVWVGHFVESVEIMQRDGRRRRLSLEEIGYGYRSSRIPPSSVILSGVLRLRRGAPEAARTAIDRHIAYRRETQPLHLPCGGSVFRNPEGHSAGALIEGVGLKGVRLRGAQISPLHANFIVNLGDAQARDVLALIRLAKERVYQESGVRLEEELRVVGDEPVEESDD